MAFSYVKIYHGPCATFYTMKHKPQRLYGLRDRLMNLGFRVDLVPVDDINYCVLEMCGHEVFRCNIKNLQFNTYYDRDPVCQRAIEAVVQSSIKFQRARSHLWIWNLIEQEMFRRGPYAPKDYWPTDLEIKPLASFKDCAKCCNIHIRQTDDEIVNSKLL